jgi:hypothetical protein
MQDDYSCQVLPPKSDQIDLKPEDIVDTEDENTDSVSAVIETKLHNVMTQGEMEILTNLFPKTAQTLADVLRNRSH